MRILQISSARALGGGERHLADLANELAARGHDVHVALSPRSPLANELRAIPKQNIVTLPLRNALDAASALELARLISKRQIEVVHAHMARDYPLAAYAVRRNRSSRLMITRHVLFPLSRLHGVTLSNVSRVIAVSAAVARRLREQQIFPDDKIVTVLNGIDVDRFAQATLNLSREGCRRKLELPPDGLLLGTVGEINPLKGHDDFVRAAAIIAGRFPESHFIIGGEDTSPTKQHLVALQRLIGELGLEKRVHRFGWLDEIADLYCALDVFVSASHSESFGLAIAEAMACGIPVVATATEGAGEIIDDAVTGVLVPIGDANSLAQAMVRLLEDSNERKRLAEAAQERVRERFSLQRMVGETEQVYSDALAKG
ncbi:MAG TPA: glycosyltransferase family 4 protein [Pyrinomonadaceae bacterium]|jgi:glycosyltransferase involved in cell wall biosynthesis